MDKPKFKRTKVEKLAEKMEPLVPPNFLQNENTAKLILKATKNMNVDDPAIFIQ
ncbi:20745_t:CDS:2 [Dentiscutata erythropus]|uniref:20745_t:CDS:1 n=1 Tax=Dentiscutata erythropus TaxID=1348616 RepID=A0A9N9I9K4_9GLOM|nr:20745_t:CDS:2 [Dentiscutata erythropus]